MEARKERKEEKIKKVRVLPWMDKAVSELALKEKRTVNDEIKHLVCESLKNMNFQEYVRRNT